MKIDANTARDQRCRSCLGTGEVGTEAGPVDCPDCGGSGTLPHPHVAIEWRVRDIERKHATAHDSVSGDLHWLIAELRRARTALTELASLAEDAGDSDVSRRLRFTVNRALELYPIGDAK